MVEPTRLIIVKKSDNKIRQICKNLYAEYCRVQKINADLLLENYNLKIKLILKERDMPPNQTLS